MGRLFVVATPIGNLGDISARACQILTEVDCILAEDTRHTGSLLKHLGISNRQLSFHEHNERSRVEEVISRLKSDEDFALVSDAGTPLISDPGYRLVNACHDAGIEVVAVPGPCAAIAALSISGLPTDKFRFDGFLPQKGARRTRAIEDSLSSPVTVILYESPYRIKKLIDEIASLDPDRNLVIAREITKKFEECIRGSAIELSQRFAEKKSLKGEFVVLISGRSD